MGISQDLLRQLEVYIATREAKGVKDEVLLLNFYKLPFKATSLGRLVRKLGRLAGVEITPHGLRRTFAALNAEKGHSLHLIQLALGHSDIRTTQEYLMSDQETVIEAMKEW